MFWNVFLHCAEIQAIFISRKWWSGLTNESKCLLVAAICSGASNLLTLGKNSHKSRFPQEKNIIHNEHEWASCCLPSPDLLPHLHTHCEARRPWSRWQHWLIELKHLDRFTLIVKPELINGLKWGRRNGNNLAWIVLSYHFAKPRNSRGLHNRHCGDFVPRGWVRGESGLWETANYFEWRFFFFF